MVAGDEGTVIDLFITETNSQGDTVAAEFNVDEDQVTFAFEFSDGSKKTSAGLFAAPNLARYTTLATDLVPGRAEIQLQIRSDIWNGSSNPRYVVNIGEKI